MTENQFLPDKRIAIVDFLRGFCLLGVVVSNYMAFQEPDVPIHSFDRFFKIAETICFGPAWISLSFLFGFGFWILIQKNKNNGRIFLQRMAGLFLIGVFNACLFHIDILRDFAMVGIFLLITPYLRKKSLLVSAIILTVCIPFLRAYTSASGFQGMDALREIWHLRTSTNAWEFIQYNLKYTYIVQIQNPVYSISVHFEMFCFFLWGVLASRYHIFQNEKTLLKTAKNSFLFSCVGILILWGIQLANPLFRMEFTKIYDLKILMEILFAIFIFTLAIFVYISGILKTIGHYMEVYGRMTLTNYLTQSLFAFLIFPAFGWGIGIRQPVWVYFTIAVGVYIFQLFFSFYWFKKYRLGPLEWLWRSMSAGKALPILKK